MKPEFQKLLNLFEELEVAGETVSLTIQSREGKSTIKLQLESQSPPSHSSTATPTIPAASAPVPGRRRRHRGAAARARRRQRAADHQGTTLAAPASAPAPHQQYHPPCDILPTSSPPLRPLQGVAKSCLWGLPTGEAASTILWMPQPGCTLTLFSHRHPSCRARERSIVLQLMP